MEKVGKDLVLGGRDNGRGICGFKENQRFKVNEGKEKKLGIGDFVDIFFKF